MKTSTKQLCLTPLIRLIRPIRLICPIPLLAFCLAAAGQTVPVFFSAKNFTGKELGRKITVTPSAETLLQTDGTNVITGGPLVLPAAAGGVVTNLWPGKYSVTIDGIAKGWTIDVPPTNALVNAARIATGLVTYNYTNPPVLFAASEVTNYVAAAVAGFAGPHVGDGSGLRRIGFSAMETNQLLLAWAMGGQYSFLTAQYDANGLPTNALVLWPDGTRGVWTATNLNAAWFTVDGFTVTYTNAGALIAQPAVSRDHIGNVTNSPPLVLSPQE